MKILIIAGGTGSIALQTGLHRYLGKMESVDGSVDIKVMVNAYDNGLSTGAVRKVMGGKILGPSDVRKNQTTRLKLENNNASSPYSDFLDIRFSSKASEARQFCVTKLEELSRHEGVDEAAIVMFERAINEYFSHSIASSIDYTDFSLANIIYAGLAAKNGNSLRAAAKTMAEILGIKDNVIVNDDRSLFLGAITESGKRILDEGDIVCWNNPKDPIVDVFFIDENGQDSEPILNEESHRAILEADYIILSSGTQWSSLIPTYASRGWKEAITKSKARVFMVMNRCPDRDAPGQSASSIIKTLVPRFFPGNRLEVLLDLDANEIMKSLDDDAISLVKVHREFHMADFSTDTKHSPNVLAASWAQMVYHDYLDAGAYMFDYDDTLVGRGNTHPTASSVNMAGLVNVLQLKPTFICSGNSIKAIKLPSFDAYYEEEWLKHNSLFVFADGGVNVYSCTLSGTPDFENSRYAAMQFVANIDAESLFDADGPGSIQAIAARLRAAGIPTAKIEDRGGVTLAIKPIEPEYRDAIRCLVEYVLGDEYVVKSTGRSTIEIHKHTLSKTTAVKFVLAKGHKSIVFIGDEYEHGNDRDVLEYSKKNEQVKFIKVKNPAETSLFILALRARHGKRG